MRNDRGKPQHWRRGIIWRKSKSGGCWHIDVRAYGRAIRQSCRTSDAREAEAQLNLLLDQARQAQVFGTRPARSFADACVRFVEVNQHLKSLRDIAARLQFVCDHVGGVELARVNAGTLAPVVAILQKRGIKARTVNSYLQDVRRVLNQAASEWIDEHGLTWLAVAPKIKMLPQNDAREPEPLTLQEQGRLMRELKPHLARMVLFALHTGAREAEVCGLRWEWFNAAQSLFFVPREHTKMKRDRIIVCNSVALDVIGTPQRGGYVFTLNGQPVQNINNTGWQNARRRAGLSLRVHDLRHTFAGRLRAAGVSPHTIADLLGHKAAGALSLTLHYSGVQLAELRQAVELLVTAKPDVLLRRVK